MLKEVNTIKGDSQTYRVNQNVKRYSLTDVGFAKTKRGNFILQRSLDPMDPYNAKKKLKISIDGDLKLLDMSTTDASGLRTIDIFKNGGNQEAIDQYHFIIKNLLDREILAINE
ncbi:cysteine desulfurase [Xylocopilactobacillus apicola]|uniref:Cysteine desulfurase n=1 Tax=Xylocopilactobacillus apicola TaxID=2932184 RepID=A0AAU9DSI0_9LACO|nr:cysteine desulfurase [Xylocopilactobacillus apicola]BDR58238.1 cysteine desulfurase [Xylocopilactobacillus apicola]